jgi:hypothetical protein
VGESLFAVFGAEFLVLQEPLFLSRTVEDDCVLLGRRHAEKVLDAWSALSDAIGLSKSQRAAVDTFSTGERAAASLVLIAALVETKRLENIKVLAVDLDSALSRTRRLSIAQLWQQLLFAPQVFDLASDGRPRRWL